MNLTDFAKAQVFEVETTANLFRMLQRSEAASIGRLQVEYVERQLSEKYGLYLKSISFKEIFREVNHKGSFRRSMGI